LLSKLENFATWRTWYFFSIGKQIYYLLIKGHKKFIHHNFSVCTHTINIKWWVYVLIIKQIIIVIYYYSMRKTKLLTSAFIFWVNLIIVTSRWLKRKHNNIYFLGEPYKYIFYRTESSLWYNLYIFIQHFTFIF